MNESRFKVFSFLWCIATLFHYVAFTKWHENVIVWIISLFIMKIILIDPKFILLLSIAQVFDVMTNMTHNNHWLITAFVNIIIIISINNLNKMFDAIKKVLIIVYFFAFLHKLNNDFLDHEVSC